MHTVGDQFLPGAAEPVIGIQALESSLPDGIHQFRLHPVQIPEQRLAGSAPGGVLYHMGVQIIQGIPG